MKLIFYMFFGIIIFLSVSCEKNETTRFETETTLEFDLSMAAAAIDPGKSAAGISELNYPFSGEGTYKGVRISNVENRLYQIQEVKPHKAPLLTISGISEGDAFESLQLEWGVFSATQGNYVMEAPIDLLLFDYLIEDGSYKVELADALVQLINTLNINPDNTIKVKLTGSSNINLNSPASLEIPVIVESTSMSLRFELF